VRIFVIISVIVVVLIAGVFFAGKVWNTGSEKDQQPTVRVEPAVRGDCVEIVSAPGEVEPRTKVSISARVSARILELPYKEGDRVTKGNDKVNPPVPPSLLVKLDSAEMESELASAEARHKALIAQVDVRKAQIEAAKSRIQGQRVMIADAERDLARQVELLTTEDVSKSVVEDAQAKVDDLKATLQGALQSLQADEAELIVMQHNINGAAADIKRVEENLGYTKIFSPIDGVVTRLNAEVGELVMTGTMNNAGTVIMEVADLSQMLLVARVDETSIAQVEVGQKAKVRMQAFRDQVFDGTVISVALAHADENTIRRLGRSASQGGGQEGTFFMSDILLDTKGKRVPSGLSADVDVETERHVNVIKVPSQAVLGRAIDSLPVDMRERPEVEKGKAMTPVVFRYVDGKAVATPVKIGPSDLTHTVIESGLEEGAVVITGPYKVLESIQHDQVVKDEKASSPTTQPGNDSSTKPASST
jgi:HlyD family secretion protein